MNRIILFVLALNLKYRFVFTTSFLHFDGLEFCNRLDFCLGRNILRRAARIDGLADGGAEVKDAVADDEAGDDAEEQLYRVGHRHEHGEVAEHQADGENG